jgi:hypothetical protein
MGDQMCALCVWRAFPGVVFCVSVSFRGVVCAARHDARRQFEELWLWREGRRDVYLQPECLAGGAASLGEPRAERGGSLRNGRQRGKHEAASAGAFRGVLAVLEEQVEV